MKGITGLKGMIMPADVTIFSFTGTGPVFLRGLCCRSCKRSFFDAIRRP
jgi:hypothetical protein